MRWLPTTVLPSRPVLDTMHGAQVISEADVIGIYSLNEQRVSVETRGGHVS